MRALLGREVSLAASTGTGAAGAPALASKSGDIHDTRAIVEFLGPAGLLPGGRWGLLTLHLAAKLRAMDASTRRPRRCARAPSAPSWATCPCTSRRSTARRPRSCTCCCANSRRASTRRRRAVSQGPEGVNSAVSILGWATTGTHPPAHQQRPRRDGVGAAATPPDGVGQATATARSACGFSDRPRGHWAQWALLADNETAQALQHGCGDDCWRSASPAALLHDRERCTELRANASSTSLAHKACV